MSRLSLASLTALTMLAFAANSLLCRAALSPPKIDPATFTFVRIASGALVLALLCFRKRGAVRQGSYRAAFFLLLYAAPFSFAYLYLPTGTGALILFGMVQVTMIGTGVFLGDRLSTLQWVGTVLSFGGLVWLVMPSVAAPDPVGALLMAVSGVGWGAYSLLGKGSSDPLSATAGNFVRALPIAAPLLLLFRDDLHASLPGLGLAIVSGAATSGLGYALWYRTLPHLARTSAAVAQLSVPVLAALAGTLLLAEPLTMRLITSSVIILGGIALTTYRRG